MNNTKPKYNEIVFTTEQLEDIKQSYLRGEGSVKIGKRYGITHKPILKALHKMGVGVKQSLSMRQYALDETYFDNIDIPNKAYILGFLFADGHNEPKKGTISMSLHEQDRDILERIRVEVKSDKPLEFIDYSNKHDFGYTYANQYRLSLFSVHMCKTMNELGMVHNKSYCLKYPQIPNELNSHFIRGYFDGNGTVSVNGGFSITTTKYFAESAKEIIDSTLGTEFGLIRESACRNGVTHDLYYLRKTDSAKIYKWLYSDAEMYLERKYNKYCERVLKSA